MQRRRVKRGLLASTRPATTVIQHLAVDEFGDLPARKRAAKDVVAKKGHALGTWHRRPNDPAGRWNAFCTSCNRIAVVATEPPEGIDVMYGHALTEPCG